MIKIFQKSAQNTLNVLMRRTAQARGKASRRSWLHQSPKLYTLSFLFITGCQEHTKRLPPLPPLSPLTPLPTHQRVSTQPTNKSVFQKLISVDMKADQSLGEFFRDLCLKNQVNLMISPKVANQKCFVYQARQTPFYQVIRDVCTGGGCQYRLHGRNLSIEKDTPSLQTHRIHFLTGSRVSQNNLTVLTDALGGSEGTRGNHRSNTHLSGTTRMDFWGELEKAIQMILRHVPEKNDPIASKNPEEAIPNPPTSEKSTSVRLLGRRPIRSERKEEKSTPPSQQRPPSPHPLPSHAPYALHQQAGLLIVYATQKQHDMIRDYLEALRKSIRTQVMVEAKIIEVRLNDTFKSGIDWNVLNQHLQLRGEGSVLAENRFFTSHLQVGSFTHFLSLMEHFGQVRTLSNPRIKVLNNQVAVLKIAKDEVFFRLEVDRVLSADNKPDLETTTSHMQTIPIGLVLMVQPSIDFDTQEVTLTLRPTLSRVVEMRNDPAVSLRSENKVHSQIPVVQTREMDSVIRVRPNHMVLLGGLMEEYQNNQSTGLPGTSHLPFLNTFFTKREQDAYVSELVILLRVNLDDSDVPEKFSLPNIK